MLSISKTIIICEILLGNAPCKPSLHDVYSLFSRTLIVADRWTDGKTEDDGLCYHAISLLKQEAEAEGPRNTLVSIPKKLAIDE